MPDLEKFGRALRLRWLRQEWVDESKPWAGSQLTCNEANRLLFNLLTVDTIGDGAKARFWHSSWLEGVAPRNLFLLVTRKNKTVQQELQNNNRIHSLRGKITTATHIEEFVSLWIRIQNAQLLPGVCDSITWKWTSDGCYST